MKKQRSFYNTLLALFCLIALTQAKQAMATPDSYIWTGASSTNWANAANWTCNGGAAVDCPKYAR
jgi:hypothetical protein